ncbi:MAG: FG-GAP repeat protein, partial [Planctomycetes bacterium]|nr:FG-GAP repeat protein [Planctomycetota bacterium]
MIPSFDSRTRAVRAVLLVMLASWSMATLELSAGGPGEQLIVAPDAGDGDWFGRWISVDGGVAAISAEWDDDGNATGSVYVFRRVSGAWTFDQKLTASDGEEGDLFGRNVSIRGDLLIAGAFGEDTNGPEAGAAYIFRHDGTRWVEEAKLLADDGVADDFFGRWVDIEGDTAVVGCVHAGEVAEGAGAVYLFRRVGPTWIQEQKLLPAAPAVNSLFGYSVAISNGFLAIGEAWDDDLGDRAGSVSIYRDNGGLWLLETKLLASDGQPIDYLGGDLAFGDGFLVVGALGDDDFGDRSGAAYVFRYD